MPSGSVRFDRASEYYDETRGLSALAMASLLAQIVPEIDSSGSCLEIGVGTGRFAIPLHDVGLEMTGIDLSRPMLEKIVEKSGGSAPFPILEADASALPFSDDSFGAAIGVHVFHLIEPWEQALDELVRVVRPGGKLLVDYGGFPGGVWAELQGVFSEAAGITLDFVGARSEEELDGAMTSRGATKRMLEPVPDSKTYPYRTLVRLLEEGAFSFCWNASADELRAGGRALREELTRRDLDLDEMMEARRDVIWRVYELP